MRLFVAVSPGEQFRNALTTRLAPWRHRLPVRWVPPENWHLTLCFLGQWPKSRFNALQEALRRSIAIDPFVLQPGTVGAFPNLRSPRVLFVQMKEAGQLERLAAQVCSGVDATWPDGPRDHHPFRAHMTWARIRKPLQRDQVNLLSQIELAGLPEISVERVRLLSSDRFPAGPRYREQAVFALRKKGE